MVKPRILRTEVVSLLIGTLTGYLLFHPYAMLMHSVVKQYQGATYNWKDIFLTTLHSFDSEMFMMAASFALFGGIIGLLTGILINKRKRLYEFELENEKKKTAMETLQRLMITLSHHLLNANTIIGVAAGRCRKTGQQCDITGFVDMIEEQSKKIDRVIGALKQLTEIKVANYTTDGRDLMIDITNEIERLSEKKA